MKLENSVIGKYKLDIWLFKYAFARETPLTF